MRNIAAARAGPVRLEQRLIIDVRFEPIPVYQRIEDVGSSGTIEFDALRPSRERGYDVRQALSGDAQKPDALIDPVLVHKRQAGRDQSILPVCPTVSIVERQASVRFPIRLIWPHPEHVEVSVALRINQTETGIAVLISDCVGWNLPSSGPQPGLYLSPAKSLNSSDSHPSS